MNGSKSTGPSWSRAQNPSGSDERPTIIQQIDLLQRIAKDAKRDLLGAEMGELNFRADVDPLGVLSRKA
jgi:hypothetical protein